MKVRRPIGKMAFYANRAQAGETFWHAAAQSVEAVSSRSKTNGQKKKHAAVDVLFFEKEGSPVVPLSCGRTVPSNKKTNTMFYQRDTVLYFWLRPKKTGVFF
jgi:hypothetical protein